MLGKQHFGFLMWCKKCTTSDLKPFTFVIFQTEHSVACYSLENVAIHMMCCITELVYLGSDAKNFTLTFTAVSQYPIMVYCTAAPF